MNKNRTNSKVSRWIMALTSLVVLFSLAFAFPSGAALAATNDAAPTPPAGPGGQQLSQAYQREQQVLTQQQDHLKQTADVVNRIQDLITRAQAKGLDTSALSNALTTFQAQVATAASSNATAAGILSAHNGFDANGTVTDQAAARVTVETARQNLVDARTVLVQAVSDLHAAVRAWEEANRDANQDQQLEKAYQGEQKALGIQQTNLGRTDNAVTAVQNLIAQAQGKGLDTSALSTALATFQSQVVTARASHTTAANILSTHTGFDASGNVTDQAAAAQTVKDAHQSLSDARAVLIQAVNDLHEAVRTWREAHGFNATPAPTPTNG